MNRIARRSLQGVALLLLLTTKIGAQGPPPVAADTSIQSGTYSSLAYGAQANIQVGPGGAAATQNKGLIRFDLSSLSGVTASDVQKAVLWVYVNRVVAARRASSSLRHPA